MTRAYIFSDEAGCFAFTNNGRASKYFLVCTVTVDDCDMGNGLHALRRDMLWRGLAVNEDFHATEDKQEIRDEVYDYIAKHNFRVDATILEKSKAQPQTRTENAVFYKYAWYYHFKHTGPKLLRGKTEALITAAALGTKKGQAVYTSAVNDVLQQTMQRQQWKTFFPRAVADPCLQVADYCAWAIQRKWERNDTRSYDLISSKISSEYDLWRTGTKHYY
jgi:Protein of unknown function (DUF3800)